MLAQLGKSFFFTKCCFFGIRAQEKFQDLNHQGWPFGLSGLVTNWPFLSWVTPKLATLFVMPHALTLRQGRPSANSTRLFRSKQTL